MTRGKYATRAEKTREVNSAISELEAGRTAIVRLTAENKKLREELARTKELSDLRIHELNARLAEGVSAELEAARMLNRELREEVEGAAAGQKETRKIVKRFFPRAMAHLMAEGHTAADANNIVMQWAGANTTADANSLLGSRGAGVRAHAAQVARDALANSGDDE